MDPTSSQEDSTSVSRSGRVRRKSSKFADFESPDEYESRTKRKGSRSPTKVTKIGLDSEDSLSSDDDDDDDDDDTLMDLKDGENLDDWGDADDGSQFLPDFDDLKDGEDDDDDDDDDENDDDSDRFDALQVDEDAKEDQNKEGGGYSQAHSLYLSEKQGKKGHIMKDGQLIQRRKAQRKDKGKSRFTAYMLWAREVRPEIIEAHPNMDFAAINKRLGELWALVPQMQRFNWRRRAKQLAAKGISRGSMISTGRSGGRGNPGGHKSNLINKGVGKGRRSSSKMAIRHETSRGQFEQSNPASHTERQTATSSRSSGYQTPTKAAKSSSNVSADVSPPSSFKVTGSSPIDVAAHLKLLGESLNNIGQKLKEHEGQIAVSGSLSVLLDSMLCVLGPLLCLTNQIEETNGAVSEGTLLSILDNIAYIMPGIV